MVDAGTGSFYNADTGHLHESLAQAGYDPAQVTTIFFTHLHPDHIGGILDSDGRQLFPNAELVVSQAEESYWTLAAGAGLAQAGLKAYAGRVRTFAEGGEGGRGIEAVPLYGHTPGHVGYSISSEGQKLLICGDLMTSFCQLVRPEIGVVADVDASAAARIRATTLKMAAESKRLVAGMHLPFPGVGFIQTEGSGYRFVPLSWLASA